MDNKPKIMFVTGAGYGIERMVLNLIGWLHGTGGWDISTVLIRSDKSGFESLPEGVEVHRIVRRNVSRGVFALARILRAERPDVIYATQIHYSITTLLAWLLAGRKGSVVVSEHGCLSREISLRRGLLRMKLRVTVWSARLLYPFAAKVHFISRRALRNDATMLRVPKDKAVVLYDPTIDARVVRMAQEDCDHSWFKERRCPVIVSVGRLSLQKGYRYLIEAIAKVNEEMKCRLVVLGEGPRRRELQELADGLDVAAMVDMAGFRENPYSCMKEADVYVMSSLWEGFGIAHAEAMACGASVVFTDCDNGPSEIVEDGVSGLLVPIQDASALAEAILELLSDESKRTRLGDAAKIRAQEFSISRLVPEYDKLFRSLL